MENERERFEGWAILELMGHRVLGGRVRDVDMFGTSCIRIDIPNVDDDDNSNGTYATQFYGGDALYCLTPTTEEVATRLARKQKPEPVTEWQLQLPPRREPIEADSFDVEPDEPW